MQTTIQEIITKVDSMRNIMVRIEDGQPIDNYLGYIYTMFEEYSDLLLNAKVKI